MKFGKYPFSIPETVFFGILTGIAGNKTATWIFDNSGLESDCGDQSELANYIAKALIMFLLAVIFWSTVMYVGSLWKKFRGRGSKNSDLGN